MTDQERITDFLCSEKKMAANYDTFASECVSIPLRDESSASSTRATTARPSSSSWPRSGAGTAPSRPRATRSTRPIPTLDRVFTA